MKITQEENFYAEYKKIGFNHCLEPVNGYPCGKCYVCLQTKRAQWSFRIFEECKCNIYNYFITLTYEEEQCPEECNKRHIQLFMKKFRKWFRDKTVRYYLTSEYGDQFGRPHYHAILFMNDPKATLEYVDEVLTKTWTYGFHQLGLAEPASIHYVTKYCLKEIADEDLQKCKFLLMSRMPMIGNSYYEKNKHMMNNGYVTYQGHKMAYPSAFRDKQIRQMGDEYVQDRYRRSRMYEKHAKFDNLVKTVYNYENKTQSSGLLESISSREYTNARNQSNRHSISKVRGEKRNQATRENFKRMLEERKRAK